MTTKRDKGKTPAKARTPGPSPERRGEAGVPIPAIFEIVVECRSERQQQDLFEHLREEGYPCRVLTL